MGNEIKQENTSRYDTEKQTPGGSARDHHIPHRRPNDYGALGYDGNELMAVISGYDLEIKFNMRLINSLADAEACANALADVFYEALMDQLIRENKPFAKPPEAKTPTLK